MKFFFSRNLPLVFDITEEKSKGFQCFDGSWIPINQFCDGHRDCSGKNWEDEPLECCKLKLNHNGKYTCNSFLYKEIHYSYLHFVFKGMNCLQKDM